MLFFFFYGALTASLMLVLAERVPNHRTLGGRSECDACGHALTLLEVLPVLGWAVLRGRTRCCGARLTPVYLGVEVVGGLWWACALVQPSVPAAVLALAGSGLVFTRGYRRAVTGSFLSGDPCGGHRPGTAVGRFLVRGVHRCGWCARAVSLTA